MNILIIYHSGVGNTRQVAEWMKNCLEEKCIVQLYSIENMPNQIEYEKFDGIIIGFPTIHTHPAKRILSFIENEKKLINPVPTFVYTTCGLYSANAVRIFCKRCRAKNFFPIQGSSYRCKATDGILLTPKVTFFSTNEMNIRCRIERECDSFYKHISSKNTKEKIPRFKLYSMINYPNKLMGQLFTFTIHVHQDKCIKCGKCAKHCYAAAMKIDAQTGFPVFDKIKCEKCYRCIHHCPQKALSLNKRKTPSIVWSPEK